MRGKWLLDNMLGAPPPPPPPDVPALKDAGADGSRGRCASGWSSTARTRRARRATADGSAGLRARELRRARQVAHGQRRRADRRVGVAARRHAVRGRRRAARRCWSSHQEDFVRTVTEKLLAYALGRGLEYHDLPAVRTIARDAAPDDYRWSSIILGIVKSTPFSMSTARSRGRGSRSARSEDEESDE